MVFNGLQQPERNPIWVLGIISIGLIVIFGGIAWAWNSGAFVQHVTSYKPIDAYTGKIAEKRIIYGQAVVSFGQLRMIPAQILFGNTGVNLFVKKDGIQVLTSPLQIDTIRLGDKSFSQGFSTLFFGSGEVTCRAKLTFKDPEHLGLQDSEEAIDHFEDFGGLLTKKENFNFMLSGYKGQKYNIAILCQSEKGYEVQAQRELLT